MEAFIIVYISIDIHVHVTMEVIMVGGLWLLLPNVVIFSSKHGEQFLVDSLCVVEMLFRLLEFKLFTKS